MAPPDRIRAHQVSETLPPNIAPIRAGETQNLLRLRRDTYSTRNAPPLYPRIPRLVPKNANPATSTLDSQLQANASHVQGPLSLIALNASESAEKSSPVSATTVRRSPMFQAEKPSEVHSSSSSEQYESSGSNPTLTNEKSRTRQRGRRALSSTDSDEDPFHFDNVLSSRPIKREVHDDNPTRGLSSSFFRRASIVPVDPNAEPAPHRFSLLRERASEETIFVQEICDAEGRRWSLRVPASGLPEDMVHMLEELEKLAVELGRALPKIVVTCSAESLSRKRMERQSAAVNSSELLHPPPAVGDGNSVGYDAGTGPPLPKEKNPIVGPECGTEEPDTCPSEPSALAVSTSAVSGSSENSLACIYLPELAPEFLSGSSTSPVLEPSQGFHSKPAQTIQCPRQRAFFSALKEPQPTSGIGKRLIMPHLTKAESESREATATASQALPPYSYSTAPPARSKSRIQARAAKSKSALPILKTTNSKMSAVAAADDRRRGRWTSLSKLPPPLQPEILKAGSAAQQQQQHQTPPSYASDHASHTKTNNDGAATSIVPRSNTGAYTNTLLYQHPAAASSIPMPSPSHPPSVLDRGEDHPPTVITPRSVSVSAPTPPTGRKLRHLFRRPPVRSASDPPLYSSYSSMRPVNDGGGSSIMRRPASEVAPPAPREVVVVEQRRMPRLPSARDLFRKLT